MAFRYDVLAEDRELAKGQCVVCIESFSRGTRGRAIQAHRDLAPRSGLAPLGKLETVWGGSVRPSRSLTSNLRRRPQPIAAARAWLEAQSLGASPLTVVSSSVAMTSSSCSPEGAASAAGSLHRISTSGRPAESRSTSTCGGSQR